MRMLTVAGVGLAAAVLGSGRWLWMRVLFVRHVHALRTFHQRRAARPRFLDAFGNDRWAGEYPVSLHEIVS